MAAEDPSERILPGGLAKDHSATALERAAGIPLAVTGEALKCLVAGHDCPQRAFDKVLLRLGVGAGDSLFVSQRWCVAALMPRRMPFRAMIVGKHKLAFLIGRER